jgi:hypothetical protein
MEREMSPVIGGKRHERDPDVFLNYVETSQERVPGARTAASGLPRGGRAVHGRSPRHQCQEGHQRVRRVWRDEGGAVCVLFTL